MQHPSRKAVLSIAAVSSVAVVIAAGIVFRRPVLEHWYLQKLESGSEQERRAAAAQLGEMRSLRAVPALVRILRETERIGDERSYRTIPLSPVPGFFVLSEITESAWERLWSAKAIAEIGCEGIPRIRDAIKDETWRYDGHTLTDVALRRAVEAMGEGAVPHLIKMARDENPNTRRLAILTLRKLDRSTGLPQVLLETLKDENHFVRLLSAWILGELGSRSKHAIPSLTDALNDDWAIPVAQEAIDKIQGSE